MSFETYFRAFSYATIAVATLSLMLAGGLPVVLATLFFLLMVAAWKFEGTKWQLSERIGLVVVLLSIPLFFLDWRLQKAIGEPVERLGVTPLAHLIVFLSAVKLLQVKKDRDWVFLYLISFFEVLLAAGLSFSPVFLGSLTLYLLCGLSTIIAFEIRKAKRAIAPSESHLLVPPDSRIFKNAARRSARRNTEGSRLPFVALLLLLLIFVLALPLFLVAPRSGAAALTHMGGANGNFTGFSENVTLGEIGNLKLDDALVMHVRIADTPPGRDIRWRGVALDEFTGRGWRKSSEVRHSERRLEGTAFFPLGTTEALHRLTTQTFFLEPIESPVLFAASRPVAIQADLPFVRVDAEGSAQTRKHEFDRIIYKALSDMIEPDVALLRSDARPYPATFLRYKQLPEALDPRIDALANAMVVNAHAHNRYDAARAIESQLRADFGYTLEMRASGSDPLADFLFNVKAGHCEYFSTAMAVMLRTQGIAARVVNGFLPGEYNETAGAYTVRQSDAHSWVEVYFPESRSWVTFDPTPAAGKTEPVRTGLVGQLRKYAEALELIWFQYVVSYDKQEQRSLATSLRTHLFDYRRSFFTVVSDLRKSVSSDGRAVAFVSLGFLIAVLLVLAAKRVRRFGWRHGLSLSGRQTKTAVSTVTFYERLTALLAQQGIQREPNLTPLEFASVLDFQPALAITRAYNRVRFGGQQLSNSELQEIERKLNQLERLQAKAID
jgi:transglutaminase-like putative cysteine protease